MSLAKCGSLSSVSKEGSRKDYTFVHEFLMIFGGGKVVFLVNVMDIDLICISDIVIPRMSFW